MSKAENAKDIQAIQVTCKRYKIRWKPQGTADAFMSRGPKSEWDVSAGVLIVEEAGGRVTDLRGHV